MYSYFIQLKIKAIKLQEFWSHINCRY